MEGNTNVAMAAEMLQQLDFAQSALGEDLFAKDIGNLLYGNTFAGLVVHCGAVEGFPVSITARRGKVNKGMVWRRLPDDAVCALPEFFGHSIAVINNKILIEDLEHFAPR